MRDRRERRRQRVCLEGALADDLKHPARRVRVRNLSEAGAELVLPQPETIIGPVAFALARDSGDIRRGEIAWQNQERVGIRFDPVGGGADRLADWLDQQD
ncbi:hypothetical protein GCM10011390_44950 [Aureimonas endophytica]|uniref:PilZ domain-containing protein n=1 Tax=Aureimonas endophytica TaxID=2027858 RepID=A0A917ECG5_9HYPH|nr:PilZ domain-containing protein [Aureimonas endophytica]GGE20660.1 hypothetical protein GCM10011390_44950 [Aureimonas endophytica]